MKIVTAFIVFIVSEHTHKQTSWGVRLRANFSTLILILKLASYNLIQYHVLLMKFITINEANNNIYNRVAIA